MEDNNDELKKKQMYGIAGGVAAAAIVGGLIYYFKDKLFGKKISGNSEDEGIERETKVTTNEILSERNLIWLRKETKLGEKRTALTPENAKKLIDLGYEVTVEQCTQRIFKDEEYEKVGCKLTKPGAWKVAPKHAFILGLKELPENDESPLKHTHIFFAHCFKGQGGWKELLQRFVEGKGNLLDLEFLTKEKRRVAAFGRQAGMVGAAVALINWAHAQKNPNSEEFPVANYWEDEESMVKSVKESLGDLKPKTIVFGALGRSGKGATDILEAAGLEPAKWDLAETKKGGPFEEILDYDIMFNCILLSRKIPPFITSEMLQQKRRLSMICDVSCDNSNPNNPIPFFTVSTTLTKPVVPLCAAKPELANPKLYGVSIDHLPTLLPRESSVAFSNALFPYLSSLKNFEKDPVWMSSQQVFNEKIKEL